MTTNRRLWLKQTGLALAGVSLWQTRLPAAPLRVPQPPPPGGPIRLSSNENPYGPSPLARQAMANAITASNRYPWEQTPELLKKIAALYGLQADHVLLGAGSSEILGLVAHLASIQKGHAISADPTFRSWWNVAEQCGLSIVKVPLTTDKKHDLAAMLSTLKNDTRLVYVCNPNNPTGTVVDSKELGDFIAEASKKCWVLLDEAYTEYSNEPSLANRVTYHKNLIVVKTFSKIYGLAGARIGYAIAHPDTIAQLGKLQPWPNAGVGAVSLAAAIASLGDHAFVADSKRQNSVAKAFTYATFQQLAVRYIPSHTNYVYYSVEGFKGDWRNALKEKNILANGIVEPTGQWSRITIGTQEEMQQFSTVIKNIWT